MSVLEWPDGMRILSCVCEQKLISHAIQTVALTPVFLSDCFCEMTGGCDL